METRRPRMCCGTWWGWSEVQIAETGPEGRLHYCDGFVLPFRGLWPNKR